MPDRKRIVINTGPILAIIAAFDDLTILQELYNKGDGKFKIFKITWIG